MKSSYKRLGDYIRPCNEFNDGMEVKELLGINNIKYFQASHTNTIGIDLQTYRIVRTRQFAYNRATTRNGDKISIGLREGDDCIVSPSYRVFEVKDENLLNSEYLMMWFRRPEFDRYARFKSHGSAHEFFELEQMCEVELPVPHIDKQREIVKEYNTILQRIDLNNQLIQKLEETAQAIYKQWFVDFEFPNENGEPYKSAGGEMEYSKEFDREIPKNWKVETLSKIANMKYGKMLNENKFIDKGYPVYSGYGIRGYYTEYLYEEPQILVVARGVSGTGEVRMSPPKCYVTNLSIVVEVNKKLIDKTYLYYFLKGCNLRSLDGGSAQAQITSGDLNKVKIITPPIKIQSNASKLINGLWANINVKNTEIKLLTTTKDVLLSKLATVEN